MRNLRRHTTEANLSLLKQGKVKGVRFDTLQAICEYLQCQPGDLLLFKADPQVDVRPQPMAAQS